MRIRFLGAAGDVTGSAYHVITNEASILVDCGYFQGRKEERAKNRRTKTDRGRQAGRSSSYPWSFGPYRPAAITNAQRISKDQSTQRGRPLRSQR